MSDSKIAYLTPLKIPIDAECTIPGSKSYTNRALILSALSRGTTLLSGFSTAGDCMVLLSILQQLGVKTEIESGVLKVTGTGGSFKPFSGTLDVRDSGTAMRFLISIASVIPGEIVLTGSARMNERPVANLVDTLITLGADISYLGNTGFPPLNIKGGKLQGKMVHINASLSSQYISSLLMIAPLLGNDITIVSTGDNSSSTYIEMTIDTMRKFGVFVESSTAETGQINYFINGAQFYNGIMFEIEPDASSASYLFALAAITGSRICVNNLSFSSQQGDIRILKILENLGCEIVTGKSIGYSGIKGCQSLNPFEVDLKETPDLALTLAIVAIFTNGKSVLKGLRNLEIKESRRLSALQTELTKIGIKTKAGADEIEITGGKAKGALINTYNDHRMAMAFAIAGAKIPGIQIENPSVVSKSFPGFWELLRTIGMKIRMG